MSHMRDGRHDNTRWRVVILVPVVLAALWGSTRATPGVEQTTTSPATTAPSTVPRTTDTSTDTSGGSTDDDTSTSTDRTDPGRVDRDNGHRGTDPVDAVDPSDPDASDPEVRSNEPDGLSGDGHHGEPVTITAVTPWVDSEGEFQLRFEVAGDVPDDAQLTYTIHQALSAGPRQSLRDAVTGVVLGGQAGRILQVPVTEPLSHFGTTDGGFLLSIPVRSRSSTDRTRAFLPNAGVHPISMVLTTADGPELWSTIVFLNHLPRDFDRDSTASSGITVGLVTPVRTSPVFASGTPEFDVHDRGELNSLRNLLRGAPSTPLRLALNADVLAGLTDSDETWAQDVLTDIETALGRGATRESDRPDDDGDDPSSTESGTDTESDGVQGPGDGSELIVGPFTRTDTNGIVRAGGRGVLRELVSLGRSVGGVTSTNSSVDSAWVLDDHVGTESLDAIESMGFTELVVSPDRFEPDPRDAYATPSPPPVDPGGSTSIRAVAYDDLLSSILTNDLIAPVNRSHDVLTVLMADWFELDTRRNAPEPASSVILVGPTVDPITASALGAALDGTGPLRSPPSGSLLAHVDDPDADDVLTVSLTRPATTDGVGSTITGFSETSGHISAFASAAPLEPLLETWRFRNAQSLSLGLGRAQVSSIQGSVMTEISGLIDSIAAPTSRRLVLGARDTTIPLRFRNGLPYEVSLILHARSPRLEMVDGETTRIELQPGDNVIDLPVIVRAPGESLLRINVTTPTGDLPIAAVDLPVRSTAISGVGAALSILSIGFLVMWWGRTFMSRRRDKARDASTHPSGSHELG